MVVGCTSLRLGGMADVASNGARVFSFRVNDASSMHVI
jgi:hypothetical protein